MRYHPRSLEKQVTRAARQFPAVVLTGPRRSGKTSLLRHLFPEADYRLLEDPDVIGRFRADPRGFLDELELPAVLDEVQNVPEILPYVRARIDGESGSKGKWFLTGSQETPLMRGVTESMAGRAAILTLLPFSSRESDSVDLLRGGYPEALASRGDPSLWFSSFLQTYLERDVRSVTAVRDLATFRRFLALIASRHGQVLNKTDLAAPLGVSVPTVTQWLGALEVTAQVLVVPPFYENLGKRLIKSPKVYVADSGMACHLLGIENEKDLERSPFLGALFEGLVASEIVKAQANAGRRRELYHFRDQQGLEVDFLFPMSRSRIGIVEAKATRTPTARMAVPLQRLAAAFDETPAQKKGLQKLLVHRSPADPVRSTVLASSVRALDWRTFARDVL